MRILVFSDVHRDWQTLNTLISRNDVDLILCAGDWTVFSSGLREGINIMKKAKKPLWVLPGNNEGLQDLRAAESSGLTSFHGAVSEFCGLRIGGIGFSPPTPFNTPGEKHEAYFRKILGSFLDFDSLDIFVSHCPPFDTKLDVTSSGLHVGSKAIREYILEHQPQYTFHGHIHECEGAVDQLGETQCRSVGKKGWLIEIDNL